LKVEKWTRIKPR